MEYVNTINDFLQFEGIDYTIERGSSPSRVEIGLADKTEDGRGFIAFMPETDIKVGDVLVDPSEQKFHVIETQIHFFQKHPYELRAYYEYDRSQLSGKQASITTYNIQNAYASIIGNSNGATIHYNSVIDDLKDRVAVDTSADKSDMEKIVSLLEMITNNQMVPQKGLLSKFSAVMERHSWLTSAFSNAIMSWLTSQIL